MTELQMKHMGLVEDHRSNIANEQLRARDLDEQERSNKAREEETKRSNLAREEDADLTLAETVRSNQAKEGLQRASLDETIRSNMRREDETERHNKVDEADKAIQTQLKAQANYREAELHPGRLEAQEAEIDKTKAQTENIVADTELKDTQERAVRYEKLNDVSGMTESMDDSAVRTYNEKGAGKSVINSVLSGVLGGLDLVTKTFGKLTSAKSGADKLLK